MRGNRQAELTVALRTDNTQQSNTRNKKRKKRTTNRLKTETKLSDKKPKHESQKHGTAFLRTNLLHNGHELIEIDLSVLVLLRRKKGAISAQNSMEKKTGNKFGKQMDTHGNCLDRAK